MPNGWGGADPTVAADASSYELGTEYLANVDITITHIRVWAHATSGSVTTRAGRIWTTAGVLLGAQLLTDTLPAGWSTYALDAPVTRTAGQRFVVSYSTGANYGVVVNGIVAGVPSADGAITATSDATAVNGNGVFNVLQGAFPASNSGAPFYGVDVVYQLGIGSDHAPVISAVTLDVEDLDVTATIVVTDEDTLTSATYSIEWGDGASSSGAVATMAHTYAAAGLYAILARVVDATELDDHMAVPVAVYDAVSGMTVAGVMDQLAARLRTIPGLRASEVPTRSPNPPQAIVAYPDLVKFDDTYGRGRDSMEIAIVLVVGKPGDKAGRDALSAYAAGSGGGSVKTILESGEAAGAYTAFRTVAVRRVEFDPVRIQGNDYMAATFVCAITGVGSI